MDRWRWLLWTGALGAAGLGLVVLVTGLSDPLLRGRWESLAITMAIAVGRLLIGAGFLGYLRFGIGQWCVLGPVVMLFGVLQLVFSFSLPGGQAARLGAVLVGIAFWVTNGLICWFLVERAFAGPARAWHAIAAFGVVALVATGVFYEHAWSGREIAFPSPGRSVELVRAVGLFIAYATLAAAFVAAALARRAPTDGTPAAPE